MPTSEDPTAPGDTAMRPRQVAPLSFSALAEALADRSLPRPSAAGPFAAGTVAVTGVSLDSRLVQPGDLYIALPGANRHGAEFTATAAAAGAAAVLTDAAGLALLPGSTLPVFTAEGLRALVGPIAAAVYRSQPLDAPRPRLIGVTGTNGKTTTTYFIQSLLRALGQSTGLIGTIEINAGAEPIPSTLTTPESTQVHALLGLMRERGLDTAAMEVSSHAVEYRRIDAVRFDVAGFTNLTQDHLDLHGSMDEYFQAKAELFSADRTARSVITVDDDWGLKMAAMAGPDAITLCTNAYTQNVDWSVREVRREGLGHRFILAGPDGAELRAATALPGSFNVANAALAVLLVLASGVPAEALQQVLSSADPLSVQVPGRMQLIAEHPAAIVDFAHNPDALERTLISVRGDTPGARVIVVFGATGQRDATKRPLMGAIAARHADVVLVTDDDPHDEDEALIRAAVLAGARAAQSAEGLECEILEVFPRAAAIEAAAALARPQDTILVAGRGHEVVQEVKGINLELDDRVELRRALGRHGFLPAGQTSGPDTVES